MFNWLVMSPHLVWGLDITSWAKRDCHVLCYQTCHDFLPYVVLFRLPVKSIATLGSALVWNKNSCLCVYDVRSLSFPTPHMVLLILRKPCVVLVRRVNSFLVF